MIRVNVFVEGQTEETFVRDLLIPYFSPMDIYLYSILVRTGPYGKGGLISYAKIKPQLQHKCREDISAFVTTFFDLFRLPADFPGHAASLEIKDPLERASMLEELIAKDIGENNLIPGLTVHEFEGLLYSETSKFSGWFDDNAVAVLSKERSQFPSPEHINCGDSTAPSKRILRACARYQKTLHGPQIAKLIGLEQIRSECKHFDRWIARITNLNKTSRS